MAASIKHLEGKYKTISFLLVNLCDDAELRLYLFLKFHAIEKNGCFPRMELITENLHWSRPKLIRTLQKMEKAGRLKIERVHRAANVYDITWYDRQNERGFACDKPVDNTKLVSRNVTQLGNETLPSWVTKRYPNYKELTTRKEQLKKRVVDKSTVGTKNRDPESIKSILTRRTKNT
jgi:hypothetical protein